MYMNLNQMLTRVYNEQKAALKSGKFTDHVDNKVDSDISKKLEIYCALCGQVYKKTKIKCDMCKVNIRDCNKRNKK